MCYLSTDNLNFQQAGTPLKCKGEATVKSGRSFAMRLRALQNDSHSTASFSSVRKLCYTCVCFKIDCQQPDI